VPGATDRRLTVGVLMMVTVTAFQALGVATVLPAVARDLGGLSAYGWSFSALMLASLLGNVAAGQAADGPGPVRPFVAGVAVFAAGSALAAAAGSWPVLLGARALQGLGLGALGALVYVVVARAFPPAQYGRMMALLSSAWVLPALVGPPIGGFVADRLGWRWVFLLLLPLVPVAAALTLPGLRGLEREATTAPPGRLPAALRLAAGGALLLGALELRPAVAGVVAALAGALLAGPGLRALLPAGTLRARRGLPSGIAVRGLLAVAYLGCDAFLPLGLTSARGMTLTQAGLVVSAGSLSWSAGALLQGRLDRRDGGAGRPGRARLGAIVLALGVALTAPAVLDDAVPAFLAAPGWVVAGFGIGTAYPAIGALSLGQAPAGEEGGVSAALQLVETVAVALFTGLGGAVVAAGLHAGWDASVALGAIFAGAFACGLLGFGTGGRLAPRGR
jgi:MFS family permease